MRAVRLYPLSCALNRAARWTLDSWLACSLQLLLPSGRCRPKRQLQDTFGKVEKTCVNNRLGILSLLYVKASISLANGKQKTTKKKTLRISIYFCHVFGAPLLFVSSFFLGQHAVVSFKSSSRLYCKFHVCRSLLMTLQCMMDDFFTMNQHGAVRCFPPPVHIELAWRWSAFNRMPWLGTC